MQGTNRILFVANGEKIEQNGLAYAVSIAEKNRADLLTVMDIGSNGINPNDVRSGGSKTRGAATARESVDEHRLVVSESAVVETRGNPRVEFEKNRNIQHVINATKKHDLLIKPVSSPTIPLYRRCAGDDRKLLRRSACPVWIIKLPASERRKSGMRILAAVDLTHVESGSLAKAVLERATALSEKENARLELVAAWQIPHELELRGRIHITTLFKQMKKLYKKQLDTLVSEFQLPQTAAQLIHGDARKVIPLFAREQEIDLVVLGEHTAPKHFIIGNTAEVLLSDAECSVLSINENMINDRVHQSAVKSKAASNAPTVL